MRKLIPFMALGAVIAVLAFWHGATESPSSKAALYLFPLLLALGLAICSFSRKSRPTRP
ncbi:hypothetical protein [uncultured Sphingomonas sp.]|uniref:hypothetical protein n=1 Tax=uncultured Sphingomonas sp. TaxID=158754 RepID=UPI0025EEA403|nr:hypothetical protein [uncultured Sphingomonas sp.]